MRISDWSSDVCSSDLGRPVERVRQHRRQPGRLAPGEVACRLAEMMLRRRLGAVDAVAPFGHVQIHFQDPALRPQHLEQRSEEHTSELQSLMRISYAVFCLKKKQHTSSNLQENIQDPQQ